MTKDNSNTITKVGPKGQVVLRKSIRDALNIKPGMVVRQQVTKQGVLIKPIDEEEVDRMMEELDRLADEVSKQWKGKKDSVAVISEGRR